MHGKTFSTTFHVVVLINNRDLAIVKPETLSAGALRQQSWVIFTLIQATSKTCLGNFCPSPISRDVPFGINPKPQNNIVSFTRRDRK